MSSFFSRKIVMAAGISTVILISAAGFMRMAQRSGPVSVSVSVTPKSIQLGGTAEYVLRVYHDADMIIGMPDMEWAFPGFSVTELPPVERDLVFRGKRTTRRFRIRALEAGEQLIYGAEVPYREKGSFIWRAVALPRKKIRVQSLVDPGRLEMPRVGISPEKAGFVSEGGLVGDEASLDLPVRFPIREDISLKEELGTGERFGRVARRAGTGLLWLAIAYFFLSWALVNWRSEDPPLPWEKARSEILALKKEGLLGQQRAGDLVTGACGILKDYIGERFGIPCKELTSKELIERLDTIDEITASQKDILKRKIMLADLVKYSSYEPEPAEIDEELTEELDFIDATRLRDDNGEGA